MSELKCCAVSISFQSFFLPKHNIKYKIFYNIVASEKYIAFTFGFRRKCILPHKTQQVLECYLDRYKTMVYYGGNLIA